MPLSGPLTQPGFPPPATFQKRICLMAHADPSSELATKPLGRLLLRFAIPSIFAQIVNLLYNIVDRIFVGRIPEIGPLALAGLGVACRPKTPLVKKGT